jgi:hypothetical protein
MKSVRQLNPLGLVDTLLALQDLEGKACERAGEKLDGTGSC